MAGSLELCEIVPNFLSEHRKGRDNLEYFGVSRKIILVWIFNKYYMRLCGMDSTVSVGSVALSCEQSKEPPGSIIYFSVSRPSSKECSYM
jgi:hypothetical protein